MVLITSLPPPENGVVHMQHNTKAHIQERILGEGTLYIAESCVSWRSQTGEGFSLEYPAISLHAVSRDLSTFPQECLYLMLDGKIDEDVNGNSSSEEEDEHYDEPTTEVRFVPADKGALDAMYNAMTECQTLHPDEQDTYSDAEEEAQYFNDEEGLDHLSEQGQINLQHIENLLQNSGHSDPTSQNTQEPVANGDVQHEDDSMETGQFEDAMDE